VVIEGRRRRASEEKKEGGHFCLCLPLTFQSEKLIEQGSLASHNNRWKKVVRLPLRILPPTLPFPLLLMTGRGKTRGYHESL